MAISRNDYSDPTLTPQNIVDNFCRAYELVNGSKPQIFHISAEWYRVNGEIVHRLTLLNEITRLRGFAQQQRLAKTDKTVIQRLISKLRGI